MQIGRPMWFGSVGELREILSRHPDGTPVWVVAYGDVEEDDDGEITAIESGKLFETASVAPYADGILILVDLAMAGETEL